MKLLSFSIQNYRSIINSGWSYLAYDNITALIGQNESGKTSVLEALRSFYEGKISDDVLRSDLTFPTVSCSFDIENRKMFDMLNPRLLPEQLKKMLEDKKEVTISRIWNEDKSSNLRIIDDDVLAICIVIFVCIQYFPKDALQSVCCFETIRFVSIKPI